MLLRTSCLQELLQVHEPVAVPITCKEILDRESIAAAVLVLKEIKSLTKSDLSVVVGVDERKGPIQVLERCGAQLNAQYCYSYFLNFNF